MLAHVTDPAGRSVDYTRDPAGRVLTMTLPGGRVVSYAYDAMGNQVAITPPGESAHNQSFEPRNLLASYAPPVISGVSATSNYGYNGDRQMTSAVEPDGALTYNYVTVRGRTTSRFDASLGGLG